MSVVLHGNISGLGIQVGHEITIALHALLKVECGILLFISIGISRRSQEEPVLLPMNFQ